MPLGPGWWEKVKIQSRPIPLDTMLNLTAAADVDGVKFDGIDLFLAAPHVDIDSTDDEVKALADKIAALISRLAVLLPPSGNRPVVARYG